jgi:hypothetical protein
MTALKKGNGNGLKAADMIEAITEAQGFVTRAADILGCSRNKFYTYLKRYPTVQEVLGDTREKRHEWVESKLMKQIKDNNLTAIIFYLKTQGKHLGYVERQEFTGKDGDNLKVEIEYVNSPVATTGLPPGTGED